MNPHRPRKRFGQHFLHDPAIIARIVAVIAPRPEQHMVEIGPGQAALTEPLLQHLPAMDVVELDRDLIADLRRRFPQLRIHEQDALKFDFAALAPPGERLRVVGNLPYNISTPLLFHLLEQADQIEDMVFMLQKEVVDRMVAKPGNKDYGRLAVMLQTYCEVSHEFDVGPGAFNPPPKVDSSIVSLFPRRQPLFQGDARLFSRLVAQAFAQRRKTLRNNLKKLLTEAQIVSLGIDPGCRADTLPLSDFVALAELLGREPKTA